eukprot:TRINITY_DN20642_c0_g1_i3.p1 TRINITY_DN20642_c0_g1~~TRINITY_DN20642_c0_g1_i3.p1  ORF type:complete len:270 (+),score=50.12 TRINITY_DN20642_c0_g1_i3:305-1114(+)
MTRVVVNMQYTKGTPHKGYELLSKWGNKKEHGVFSVTSNIDGHWARTAGIGCEKIYECHGALTHMQQVASKGSSSSRIWPTDAADYERLEVPVWDLQSGEQVEALVNQEWIAATVTDDGRLVNAAGRGVQAMEVRRQGGPDLMRVSEASELPTCALTGKPARPNVLMFGDWEVIMNRIEEQQDRFECWKVALPREARLAIVEVGAGKAVPTIRNTSGRMLRQFPNATLVRLNFDDADLDDDSISPDRAVLLGGVGALDALSELDTLMEQ